jgi:hypothetical protein
LQSLDEKYESRGVTTLVINVREDRSKAAAWKNELKWTIPVLLDRDGSVAASFAPEGMLPDLPREQVPIAANLIIDREGAIQFYSLLDSRNFDAKLIALKAKLNDLLAAE